MRPIEKIAVVSACYGTYDIPKPPTRQDTEHPVEFIMVSDSPNGWPGWKNVYEPRHHLHANVAAKIPKLRPDLYTDANYTIWIDAGCNFTDQLVNKVLTISDYAEWTMFTHPHRVKLCPEVEVSRMNVKYEPMLLEKQIETYLAEGYPDDQLWGTGLMGRYVTDFNKGFGDAWLREICRWSFQDQLSFPYLCWKYGLKPVSLGKRNQLEVDWVRFADHTQKSFEEGLYA